MGIDSGKEQFDKEIRPIREKYLKEALDACPSYDEVIFIGGLNHAYDVEGFDRPDMTLPYGQNEVIEALTEKCKNLTVVLINGGPVEMPWINKVNSLIQTSYCGMHGGLALARVLFGEVNPSGHLAANSSIFSLLNGKIVQIKGCVAKTVSKWEENRNFFGFIIAVANH